MDLISSVAILILSLIVVWFFAGVLLDSVGRLARRLRRSGFGTAFFVLGALTSISEISVATNAGLSGVPGVSAGNLVGASFVILLLIVPFLAVAGRGISLKGLVSKETLAFALMVIALPALLLADGRVTMLEGTFAIFAYLALAYSIRHRPEAPESEVHMPESAGGRRALIIDLAKILVGAIAIFIAAHFLVGQSVQLAQAIAVPASLVGLILLSIGTNIPEIVIAVRAVLQKRKDIAFGDYLGSAAANVPVFGALALFTGGFAVEASEFVATALLMLAGLMLFYFFARSHAELSRKEGMILLLFYGGFLLVQFVNIVRFAAA
jgi:cation:H+ antiporter